MSDLVTPIHDTNRTPADFRLYLTATPGILAAPRPQKGADGQEAEFAAMADDPNGTYGAWPAELGLSEAIEREILAGFEIDVMEIRNHSPVVGESEGARRGRRAWRSFRAHSWNTRRSGTSRPS